MLSQLKSILNSNGYTIYSRPYQLNIVGVRSISTEANKFDDQIHVFYMTEKGIWNYHIFDATTDPGTYWLKNPMQSKGTAILAQGQYLDAYGIGLHRGKYKALVQTKPVTIIRDYDRDALLDFNNGMTITGLFGINIHRAAVSGRTVAVDKYSAGCQVFADAKDFNNFMSLCEKHSLLYGNKFTYTLIDFRALRRKIAKNLLLAGTAALAFGVGAWFYNADQV